MCTHLEEFEEVIERQDTQDLEGGKNPSRLTEGLDPTITNGLPDEKLNKEGVRDQLQCSDLDIRQRCVVILAWGGIRKGNLRHLLGMPSKCWLDHAETIQTGDLTRSEVYAGFNDGGATTS